jgi:hypothetical protein
VKRVAPALAASDALPHLTIRTIDGSTFAYSTIWQQRNLVLVALPDEDAARTYAESLQPHTPGFDARNTVLVVTRDPVRGLPAPGVVVADRWGEIVHVVTPSAASELPPAAALVEWLDFLEQRCPECEGEAR